MNLAVHIMTYFTDHLISLRHFKCLSRLTICLPRAPLHCKKECFETPLLVAAWLQTILVFGNTILKHNERLEILSVAV